LTYNAQREVRGLPRTFFNAVPGVWTGEPMAEPVDVVAIMKGIRETIQKKRAQGVYTDEEVESLAALRLRAFAEDARIDDKLLERLLGPSHEWNIGSDYLIRTTRTGMAARALILAKKVVRPFIRLYTDHIFNRQAQLNLYFAHLLHNSIREGARLQLEMQGLRHRVEELERELVLRRGDPVDRRRKPRDEPGPR
jgi:hypothetical protein